MSTIAPPAPFISQQPDSHVRCPVCRRYRVVGTRQARRIRAGENTGICSSCRGEEMDPRPCADEHLRFWLRSFGVRLPRGMTAREAVRAGFAPPDLVELAQQVWPH